MGLSFEDLVTAARNVRDGLESETGRIIIANKEHILDYNRYDQLFDKGIDSDGKFIGFYSPFTISLKRQASLPYNRVTLFQEGNFYKGFDLLFSSRKLTFFSRDSKTTLIQDHYPNASIFGLTTENNARMDAEILQNAWGDFINRQFSK